MKEFKADVEVFNVDERAVATGVCLVANSGGEGRVQIGPSKHMRVSDVVGRAVGVRVTCRGKSEVKQVLAVGRNMPAKHEVEFTAAETCYWVEKGGEFGEVDEVGRKEYEGRRNMKERREKAEELEVEIVQTSAGGEWETLPMVEEDGRLDFGPFKPLVFTKSSGETVCPNATLSLTMDSGGIVGTRLVRSSMEIEEDVKAEEVRLNEGGGAGAKRQQHIAHHYN